MRSSMLEAGGNTRTSENAGAQQKRYSASPNEVTSRSMVDPLRRNDFIYGVVVTSFDEVL
jgi:hypothetical protein